MDIWIYNLPDAVIENIKFAQLFGNEMSYFEEEEMNISVWRRIENEEKIIVLCKKKGMLTADDREVTLRVARILGDIAKKCKVLIPARSAVMQVH